MNHNDMKLTETQKEALSKEIEEGDWEAVHSIYDGLMTMRVKELDSEFLAELDEITKDATFWYA